MRTTREVYRLPVFFIHNSLILCQNKIPIGLTLHIVSFDVPCPPDYGGVIDVYYKLKALKKIGVDVILHCFQYGRKPSDNLKALCKDVYYYPRKSLATFFTHPRFPYIVASRKDNQLLKRLSKDNHPILFEGLHTCFYLNHPNLQHKQKWVRMHNVEWEYYNEFAKAEKHLLKKEYYRIESRRLKHFESILQHADKILTISQADTNYYAAQFSKIHHLPPFHSNEKVDALTGKGNYCLYHGNLKVIENHKAASFLLTDIFNTLEIPLIIAGANPRKELKQAADLLPHVSLIPNPDEEKLNQLIRNAQVHVLITFQATGIKLKLLKALYHGRHCLVNQKMIEGTGVESLVKVAGTIEEYKKILTDLFNTPFQDIHIHHRKAVLYGSFSNQSHAVKIKEWLASS